MPIRLAMRRPVYIWLDPFRPLEVHLSREVLKALRGQPAKQSGLLLGARTEANGFTTIAVESFEPVALDSLAFEMARRQHPYATGLYYVGNHAETAPAAPSQLPEPDGVWLSYDKSSGTATLHMFREGVLAPVHTFSMDFVVPPERSRIWAVRAAALLAGAGIGALAWNILTPQSPPAETPAAQVQNAANGHLALRVQQVGTELQLTWNPDTSAALHSDQATLSIVDGNHNTKLILSAGELDSGKFSYWPESSHVTFRLQTRNTDDSIASAAPAHRSVAPVVPVNPDRPSPFASPDQLRATPAFLPGEDDPGSTLEPAIQISTEPASESRLNRVAGKIPLLKWMHKRAKTETPPTPVKAVRPNLTATQKRALTEAVPVDVKVRVDDTGKVESAELLGARDTPRYQDLASAALYAARRWDFRPAQSGDQPVPADMILHFRFAPGNP